jgi:hypothetical protein
MSWFQQASRVESRVGKIDKTTAKLSIYWVGTTEFEPATSSVPKGPHLLLSTTYRLLETAKAPETTRNSRRFCRRENYGTRTGTGYPYKRRLR